MEHDGLDLVLARCQREDVTDQPEPLYIDECEGTIKCAWCPSWKGSIGVKVVNQHVRKAVSHDTRVLNNEDQEDAAGVYRDIHTFFNNSYTT